ncbi:MAG: tetratricopeptide repeat protein [Anaerolineae bacterium]|nr:tetratricopeptide repeat protein [Anaerolineae bacterium]
MSTLQEAIKAIKSGDKAGGKQILARFLKAEPTNEAAWLWLAQALDNDEQRRHCLEQVLKINPDNEMAQRGMAILQQQPAKRPQADAFPEPRRKRIKPLSSPAQPPPAGANVNLAQPSAPGASGATSAELLKRANILLKQGEAEQARQLLQQALAVNPINEDAWEKLVDIAPTPEARGQIFKEWLRYKPDSRRASQKLKRLTSGGRSKTTSCLVWGILAIVMIPCLVIAGVSVWLFGASYFEPDYLHEDALTLVRMKQVRMDDVRNMAFQVQQKKSEQLQREIAYSANAEASEKALGLLEYWTNTEARRFKGYVEIRPPLEDNTGAATDLEIGKAVLVFEFWGDSIIYKMPDDEKTKYIRVEAKRTFEAAEKWEVAKMEEVTVSEFLPSSLVCYSCMTHTQTPSIKECRPYWQLIMNLDQENAGAVESLPQRACQWISMR